MAKQNFLSGGYYGKLGATVGQRWKNIRTIRTYVIPHNPRTPAQQANRSKFSQAVPYAQLGQQVNFGTLLFKSESTPEWGLRMKSAIANINAGLSDVGIVPTYPTDFNAPYKITSGNITDVTSGIGFEMEVAGDLPEGARNYSAILYLSDVSEEFQYLVCAGVSTAENPDIITFTNPNTSKLVLSPIVGKIISTDDTTLDTVVASGKIPIQYQGSLLWSWGGASPELGFLSPDGDFEISISKDGIGDGSYTGSVTAMSVEGTLTLVFDDSTSEVISVSSLSYESFEGSHGDNTNTLAVGGTIDASVIDARQLVRAVWNDVVIAFSFDNYRQNGYTNAENSQYGYYFSGTQEV